MSVNHRLVRWIFGLLVGLLVVPSFVVNRAGAASAAEPPAPAAAVQPGHAPVECVNDVERQFNSLNHHPDALGYYLDNGAFDPTSGRHYQGIARLPGEGPARFITSRNGNPGPLEPTADPQPGEINVVELASRETNGERVRSNRLVANEDTEDTPPPAEDRVINSLKFTGESLPGYPGYRHIGGMQMWGDIAILGMDRPDRDPITQPPGEIVFMNFADPTNPYVKAEFPINHQASSIGVAPFGDNRLLIVTTGNNGTPLYGYEVVRKGQPTRDVATALYNELSIRQIFAFDPTGYTNIGWPTDYQSLQTTNLFRDCQTGDLYLMGGYNLTPLPNISRDRIGLWKLDPFAAVPLGHPVSKRQVWCDFDNSDRLCNLGAASGFYASPRGDLIMYATPHDNEGPGPGGSVSMAEFSSQDGYDQDRAYRPTAVPGNYKAAVGSPITLDGTGSQPAIAQGRVTLFDDTNFNDRTSRSTTRTTARRTTAIWVASTASTTRPAPCGGGSRPAARSCSTRTRTTRTR